MLKMEISKSLKKINNLITIYPSNFYLIETKADILFSYGYTEEALKFYTKILGLNLIIYMPKSEFLPILT